ncbi:MAG TPA: hypothetical protein IGS17_07245 [Oscillatoriales cyanobacterium M59_W2019_021]|nr:MAG: hypothetical protein D6728_00100 [Cyanobacteria bacterium J055]HIK34069.1 hypothetical protein [Oscillatoriales cyanobacterium M4454_W2019_049]HIK50706.1 hypothetical protein [Oscillatoriales cyanobacterium M59_W2019_021]
MKQRVKLLSLTVAITVSLLILGAILVVLGIFDELLQWDIFSYQVEAVLMGVFFTSLALSAFGVAMTIVLGIQEIVTSISAFGRDRGLIEPDKIPEAKKQTYALYIVGIIGALAILIAGLSLVDRRVQVHRSQVFKTIASEQLQKLQSRFIQQLVQLQTPPQNNVPRTLHDLIQSVQKLSFVSQMAVYLPDSQDNTAIWSYQSFNYTEQYDPKKGFERLVVAKEYEQAIQEAFQGQPELLKVINDRTGFTWYYDIKNPQGKTIAVLRINGDPDEDFREYQIAD